MTSVPFGIKGLNNREYEKFFNIGSDKTAVRVNDSTVSSNKLSISAESVSFSAGAAGTTGVVTLDTAPLLDLILILAFLGLLVQF